MAASQRQRGTCAHMLRHRERQAQESRLFFFFLALRDIIGIYRPQIKESVSMQNEVIEMQMRGGSHVRRGKGKERGK